jgi:Outer membrane protein beta-barrel domain
MRRGGRVLALAGIAWMVMSGSAGAQMFEGGVKIGVAVTSLPLAGEVFDQAAGQDSRDSSSRVGVTGGGYISFPMAERLSFQPEVLFVMKGVKLDETDGGTLTVRLRYFDVPLLVRYRTRTSSQTPIYVFGGPNFGMKVGSGSAKLKSPGNTADIDIDSALKSLDLGITVGGGIERGRCLIEARYTAGVTDIASTTYPHPDRLRNRTFSAMVGLKLK